MLAYKFWLFFQRIWSSLKPETLPDKGEKLRMKIKVLEDKLEILENRIENSRVDTNGKRDF